MARPRSEDKRNAILHAAMTIIAQQGESAPTAKIAKLAGVAEGTLFTYFDNKDELLSHLYLHLKDELRQALMVNFPYAANLKNQTRYIWQSYVNWGVQDPDKRKALSQLAMSERVSEAVKAIGQQAFAHIYTQIKENTAKGLLRDYPPDFTSAILESLAQTSIAFMLREPELAQKYSDAGFDAFWNAIAVSE